MKYLVNRDTKEHKVASEQAVEAMTNHPAFNEGWQLVEADSEGWIPWSGGECPLPEKSRVQVKYHGGACQKGTQANSYDWKIVASRIYNIAFYRPILSETAEKEQTEEEWNGYIDADDDAASVFDRLKSSIAASESIPGIIAEIDALLPDGYCVAKVAK